MRRFVRIFSKGKKYEREVDNEGHMILGTTGSKCAPYKMRTKNKIWGDEKEVRRIARPLIVMDSVDSIEFCEME